MRRGGFSCPSTETNGKNCRSVLGLSNRIQAGYEFVEFSTFEDIRENEAPFVNDDLIFLVQDFSGTLFDSIVGTYKRRIPKITVLGKSYFLNICEDRENEGLIYNKGRHIFNTALLGKGNSFYFLSEVLFF